jgi:DNA-binding transcriptional MocR family regulator
MTLYEEFADDIEQAIRSGVLRPGDRLPSIREASGHRRVSPSTVFKAYYLLEARGLISGAQRSGYYVRPRPLRPQEPQASRPPGARHAVDSNDLVYEILASLKHRRAVPLGSAFPDPNLFPLDELRQALVRSMRGFDPWHTLCDLPPGNETLRRLIRKRYLLRGTSVSDSEIVLTHGAMPALHLCLEALTSPGDSVVVESPCFYVALQALQRLGLKAVEVATDSREGVDLGQLAKVLERQRPAACWLMPTLQNPLGASMPDAKKRELVALLARHEVPLVEDDVYEELYQGNKAPASAKHFDRRGLVLHCSSFSKCLAPGYRVGWAAAGRFGPKIERLKLMTLLSGSVPVQDAIAMYLQERPYEAHLRRLRTALATQQALFVAALARHFPPGTLVSRPAGGYFVWLELPAGDAMQLFDAGFAEGVSLAPGPMFSARQEFRHCMRLNTGQVWSPAIEHAIARLGRLAQAAAAAPR